MKRTLSGCSIHGTHNKTEQNKQSVSSHSVLTSVQGSPTELEVERLINDLDSSQQILEISIPQYLKMVESGLLPKADNHCCLVSLSKIPNDDTKMFIIPKGIVCGEHRKLFEKQ